MWLVLLSSAAKFAAAKGVSNITSSAGLPPASVSAKELSEGEAEPQSQPPTTQTAVTNGDATREAESDHEKDEKMVVDEEEARKKSEEEERAKELQKAQDKSRPVSSTPVPGTPW
jgi:transcription elongation regulator 1